MAVSHFRVFASHTDTGFGIPVSLAWSSMRRFKTPHRNQTTVRLDTGMLKIQCPNKPESGIPYYKLPPSFFFPSVATATIPVVADSSLTINMLMDCCFSVSKSNQQRIQKGEEEEKTFIIEAHASADEIRWECTKAHVLPVDELRGRKNL
ncbi:unnamed protein product [Calicophoron daubneyi]|uniref:Uncharacterized protein n=1 Tax=Calicophoron daubneyi TaxID=300641 RepID=A0AAV2TXL8_CALDB